MKLITIPILFFMLTSLIAVGQKAADSKNKSIQGSSNAVMTLQPRLFLNNGDTTFCFTAKQAREIAKLLTAGEYDLQAIELHTKQIEILKTDVNNLRTALMLKDMKERLQDEKIAYRDTVIDNQTVIILNQGKDLLKIQKQAKNANKRTKLVGVLGIIATILALII